MKRVKKFTSKHVAQMKRDADKLFDTQAKIRNLRKRVQDITDSYKWMNYLSSDTMDDLSASEQQQVSEYYRYIKSLQS